MVEDQDLTHLDTTVCHTLPLVSTILSATDALSVSLSTHSHNDAFNQGVISFIHDKLTLILGLLSHHSGSMTAIRHCWILQHYSYDDQFKAKLNNTLFAERL